MLLCNLTDKDLHRICRNQYEHPGYPIGYWPEMSLGNLYIVLEPVGSARLTLRWQLYYEFMSFDVPKFVRCTEWDYGHDEESRNGQDMKIDILEGYVWTPERFQISSGIFWSTGWDHEHDEESRNGREVKIDILDEGIWTPWNGFGAFQILIREPRATETPGEVMGPNGP